MLLAGGKTTHATRDYTAPLSILEPDAIRAGHAYQQWSDVMDVLSEYNARTELLLKYLTIYHVIENFMFKLPLVRLERQQGGRMFSIRDFRRLYGQIEKSETDALRRLIGTLFPLPAGPVTFEQHIVARWMALPPELAVVDIDQALTALDLSWRYADFVAGASAPLFAKLVYSLRNAIVHNKETEFHLTYASLDATLVGLIERFLIPCLEEICFSLISSPNQQVWYSNRELLLYS